MIREGKGWTMHLGDMADVLPGLERVDHVITDPPYEAEAHRGARRCPTTENKAGDYEIPFEQITDELRARIAVECKRLASRWALIFCQVEGVAKWQEVLVEAGAKWRRAGVWIKPDGAPQFTGDRWAQGFECIAAAWCGDGKSRWNCGGKRGVYVACVNDFGRLTGGRPHPTMKPLDLMEALVRDFTSPGDLILDPFAGSGSTGVAALRNGRRFVGVEKDPRYFEIACKRLEQTREQLRLIA